jgi:hypothetical protein
MRLGPCSGVGLELVEIALELMAIDTPYAAPTDLDGGELVTSSSTTEQSATSAPTKKV